MFSAHDLLELGARETVNRALARLACGGQIRRLARGLYDLPRVHPRVGVLWPPANTVALALARRTGSRIKASGPLAANLLGLTTQVPARVVYLTDGPSRSVRVGRLQVTLRHAGRVDMLLPDTRAGLAIVALKYLGRDGATPEVLERLSAALEDADKALLQEVRPEIPGWPGEAVEALLLHLG